MIRQTFSQINIFWIFSNVAGRVKNLILKYAEDGEIDSDTVDELKATSEAPTIQNLITTIEELKKLSDHLYLSSYR